MTVNTRSWALAMATFFFVLASGVIYSNPQRQPAPNQDQMRRLLAPGRENRAKWWQTKDDTIKEALNAQLQPILVAARPGLQEIPAGRGDRVRFVPVVLNSTGAGFDAVRFRTPATGETYNMRLEIVVPGNNQTRNLKSWDVAGVDGPSQVVGGWSRRDSFDLPSSGFPDENYCMTSDMTGPPLRPDSEYIVWIELNTDKVTPAFVKVALTTDGEAAMLRTSGLPKARVTFQTALRSLNQKYDVEIKGLRKTYLAELDKAGKAAAQQKDQPEADRIVAEAEEIVRGDPEVADPRGFRIISARFGVDERWADVTDELTPLIRGNVLRFGLGADVNFKKDPAHGVLKRLIIVYSLNGNTGVSITTEKQRVELPPTAPILDRIPPVGSYKP